MYKIYFYKDKSGKEPVAEYLLELSSKHDKNSRIKLNKIRDYIKVLEQFGLSSGESHILNILKMICGSCVLLETEYFLYPGMVILLFYYIIF